MIYWNLHYLIIIKFGVGGGGGGGGGGGVGGGVVCDGGGCWGTFTIKPLFSHSNF